MPDYIEREALIQNLEKFAPEHFSELIKMLVMKQPAADVAPVVHGEWQMGESGCMFFCSECELWVFPRESRVWNYCPICGAKMDGGNRNADA